MSNNDIGLALLDDALQSGNDGQIKAATLRNHVNLNPSRSRCPHKFVCSVLVIRIAIEGDQRAFDARKMTRRFAEFASSAMKFEDNLCDRVHGSRFHD